MTAIDLAPGAHPLIAVRTDLGVRHVPAGTTVAHLLAQLADESPALADAATAVNGVFVARSARDGHVLHDGDALMCFSPITGG